MTDQRMFEHLLREIDKVKRRLDYSTRAEVPRPFSGARAIAATQSIPNTTWTAINYASSESFDTHGLHDLVTNPNRFTIITPGYYFMVGDVTWATSGATAQIWHSIYLNTTTLLGSTAHNFASGAEIHVQVSAIYYLVAGNWIDLAVWHDTGTARNASGTFAIGRIG